MTVIIFNDIYYSDRVLFLYIINLESNVTRVENPIEPNEPNLTDLKVMFVFL